MAVVENDGKTTNEEKFWAEFEKMYGENVRKDESLYYEYYLNLFDSVKAVCGYNQKSGELVARLNREGYKIVLATNPVFPQIATEHRIEWAGIDKNEFIYISTYENSSFCKPNPKYYEEILFKINAKPEECLMIGNDTSDDMIAEAVGMDVFLLTDCLINLKGIDISKYPNGNFDDLEKYIVK